MNKFDLKTKIENLAFLKKPMKINNQSVVVDSLNLFHRLILVAERITTVEEILYYELIQLPMSLFHKYQYMRKTNKASLGAYIKDLVQPIECNNKMPLVIE